MREISWKRKGQVTIFIIIAIMIVIIGVLSYLFYPKIGSNLWLESMNPSAFIQNCMEEDIKNSVERLSMQGGSLKPEHYFLYNDEKVEYLCYTEEYYKTCVVQQPMLKKHIESEIKKDIRGKAKECFDSMKESYEKRGYKVSLKQGEPDVELLPKRIVATFSNSLTLTKESSESYDNLRVVLNNNLYELLSIANSIIAWETRYGDAETTTYMNYYRDLKVEKKKQSDGTTIYILTDLNSGNKFQFASRSLAWPPGYGVDEVLV